MEFDSVRRLKLLALLVLVELHVAGVVVAGVVAGVVAPATCDNVVPDGAPATTMLSRGQHVGQSCCRSVVPGQACGTTALVLSPSQRATTCGTTAGPRRCNEIAHKRTWEQQNLFFCAKNDVVGRAWALRKQ